MQNLIWQVPILFIFVMSLNACATLSKDECLLGDWYTIGYTDGARGKDIDRLAKHAKACDDYSVLPNRADYEAGRRIGLTYHCADSQAYKRESLAIRQDTGDWEAIGREDGQAGELAEAQLLRHRTQCSTYGIQVQEVAYNRGYSAGIALYCKPENGYQQGKYGNSYEGACPLELEAAFLGRYLTGLNEKIADIDRDIDYKTSDLTNKALKIAGTKDKDQISSLESQINNINNSIRNLRSQQDKLRLMHSNTAAYLSRLRLK